jgi:hypothetical protein
MSATAQAQAEAAKAAQRAGIEHAKANDGRAYLGRKPSYTREQFNQVREMLWQQAAGIAQIARHTKLTRQMIYRIKDDPAGAEALWQLGDRKVADSSDSEGNWNSGACSEKSQQDSPPPVRHPGRVRAPIGGGAWLRWHPMKLLESR